MEHLDLGPFSRASGTVRLPGSKSISNRVLLLAALAEGETTITNLLDSDDTRVMLAALATLGVRHAANDGDTCVVTGTRGAFPAKRGRSVPRQRRHGGASADGRARRQRRRLSRARRAAHARAADRRSRRRLAPDRRAASTTKQNDGFPPLRIRPAQIAVDAPIRVRGDVSSQFLTALLMTLPLVRAQAASDHVEVDGELISKPYIEITINLMERFGVARRARRLGSASPCRPARSYQSPGTIMVEGDASSASYFLAAGAIGGGPVRVEGVGRASIQGDVGFADALIRMGANVMMGDDWIEVRGVESDDGKLDADRHGLQPDPRRRDDDRRRRAVRRRHDHAAQYRELAREGNRPHRRDGDRAAQGRRDGRGGRGLSSSSRRPPR